MGAPREVDRKDIRKDINCLTLFIRKTIVSLKFLFGRLLFASRWPELGYTLPVAARESGEMTIFKLGILLPEQNLGSMNKGDEIV